MNFSSPEQSFPEQANQFEIANLKNGDLIDIGIANEVGGEVNMRMLVEEPSRKFLFNQNKRPSPAVARIISGSLTKVTVTPNGHEVTSFNAGDRIMIDSASTVQTTPNGSLRSMVLVCSAPDLNPIYIDRADNPISDPKNTLISASSVRVTQASQGQNSENNPSETVSQEFNELQTLVNNLEARFRKSQDTIIRSDDGMYAVTLNPATGNLTLLEGSGKQLFEIRKIEDSKNGEINYVIVKGSQFESTAKRRVGDIAYVVSNSKQYNGTQYIRISDLLNITGDIDAIDDVTIEVLPDGTNRIFPRLDFQKDLAAEVIYEDGKVIFREETLTIPPHSIQADINKLNKIFEPVTKNEQGSSKSFLGRLLAKFAGFGKRK